VGLGLIGVVSSQLTSWLVQSRTDQDASVGDEVTKLRDEIAELRVLLEQHVGHPGASVQIAETEAHEEG
jgi:hypothetical protein